MAVSHRQRKLFNNRVLHITIRTGIKRVNFNNKLARGIILRQLKILSHKKGVAISSYCICHNHLHLLLQYNPNTNPGNLPVDRLFGNALRSFFSTIAKGVNRLYLRSGKLFEDRYFQRPLKSTTEIISGFRYVILNRKKALSKLNIPVFYNPRKDPNLSIMPLEKGWFPLKLIGFTIKALGFSREKQAKEACYSDPRSMVSMLMALAFSAR